MSVASGAPNSSAERSCAISAGESSATRSSSGALPALPSEGSVSVAATSSAIHATGTAGWTASSAHAYQLEIRPGRSRARATPAVISGAGARQTRQTGPPRRPGDPRRRRCPRALTSKALRMNGCTRQKYV